MAVPAVLIYSVAGEPLLRIVFGEDLTEASDALPFLGLRDVAAGLLVPVGAVPAGDGQGELPVRARRRGGRGGRRCCSSIGDDLTAIAIALLGIQAVCAATILTMAMRQKTPDRPALRAGLTADAGGEDEVVPEAPLRHVGAR